MLCDLPVVAYTDHRPAKLRAPPPPVKRVQRKSAANAATGELQARVLRNVGHSALTLSGADAASVARHGFADRSLPWLPQR